MGLNNKNRSYTEIFEEVFPYYLSLGMTYEEFWEGDCTLPKFYREAQKIKSQKEFDDKNFFCWLQGRYIYDALCCASPLFRTNFGKGIVAAHKYYEEPIKFNQTEDGRKKEELREQEKENELMKVKLFFHNWVNANQNLPKA